MTRPPVLVVIDDEPNILTVVERIAHPAGFEAILHASAREALDRLPVERPDVALADLQMPELGGLDVLRAIRQLHPECKVILTTRYASFETAIEAVKLGALDYLSKPLDLQRLLQRLIDVKDDVERRAEILATESATAKRLELCGMIGRSAVMQELFGLVRRVAPHAKTALVTGESGVGKEGLARAIHQLGPRNDGRFTTHDCAAALALPVEDGRNGGTLFLDHFEKLRPDGQAALLQTLETAGALRLVAATNRNLRAQVESGRLRGDLFSRLSVVELHVPPLRERREDIPYLTAAFVNEFASRLEKAIEGISPSAEQRLMSAPWPGNVRELRNVLERACMLADGRTLTQRELAAAMPALYKPEAADLNSVERDHIARILAEVGGNKVAAARRLGISRRTLYRRLVHHRLLTS